MSRSNDPLMPSIPRPSYSSLRKSCFTIAVLGTIYRVVLSIYLGYESEWSNPKYAADYYIRIVWGIILATQWVILFIAVYKEHVCLMFTMTYVEFLELVGYNMYRIIYLTNHTPTHFYLFRMSVECVAMVLVFPIIYLYYKQMRDKMKYSRENNYEDQHQLSRLSTLASIIIFPLVYFYYLQLKNKNEYWLEPHSESHYWSSNTSGPTVQA